MFGLQEKGNALYEKIMASKEFTDEEKALLIQGLKDSEKIKDSNLF